MKSFGKWQNLSNVYIIDYIFTGYHVIITSFWMKLINVVQRFLETRRYFEIMFQDKFVNDKFRIVFIFIQNVLMMLILFFLVRCPHSQSTFTIDTNWQVFWQSQLGDKWPLDSESKQGIKCRLGLKHTELGSMWPLFASTGF